MSALRHSDLLRRGFCLDKDCFHHMAINEFADSKPGNPWNQVQNPHDMTVTIQSIVLNFSPKPTHILLSLAELMAVKFHQKAGEACVLWKEHFLFSVHPPAFLWLLLVLFSNDNFSLTYKYLNTGSSSLFTCPEGDYTSGRVAPLPLWFSQGEDPDGAWHIPASSQSVPSQMFSFEQSQKHYDK